jgi:arylsulfatase A-like enzyme
MSAAGTRPNILILLADQLRADVVGVNGSPICRTPNLDALAAAGTSFRRAYTTTPLCTPARAALFTGRYPHSNGLTANTQYPDTPTPRLHEDERTLFEHLAAAGYRVGYTGKWHLSVADESIEAHRRGVTDFFNGHACTRTQLERLNLPPRDDARRATQRTMRGDHPPMSGVTPYPTEYQLDACIAAQASHLIRQYRADGLGTPDRPFALVCSLHGPHFPIEVPEPFASLYDPASVPKPASFDDTFEGKPQGQRTHPWLQLASHLSWPEWQRVIAHYWGFVTFIDSLFGQVLGALNEAGLYEQTIVFATADHGEMAGHHRMFDKGPYFYEDVMRVPAIWRWPSHVAASGLPTTAHSHVDVVPTLLDLAGLPPARQTPAFQGESLASVLRPPFSPVPPADSPDPNVAEKTAEPGVGAYRPVFAETNVGDQPNPQIDARMVVSGSWKYVLRTDDVPEELYELSTDPDELTNLASRSDCPEARLAEMRSLLTRWQSQTLDTMPPVEKLLAASPVPLASAGRVSAENNL